MAKSTLRRSILTSALTAATLAATATLPANAAFLTGVGEFNGVDGVWQFNTATGNASSFIDTSSLTGSGSGAPGGNNVFSPNSLGNDTANKRLYFSTYDNNNSNSELFSLNYSDLNNPILTNLGTVQGDTASGAFYNGDFFYVENRNSAGTPDGSVLYRVDIDNTGSIASVTGEFNLGSNQSFGDIAFDEQGVLYGNSTNLGVYTISGTDLFDGALDSDTGKIDTLFGTGIRRQLAFDAGTLYAVDSGDNEIFTLNAAMNGWDSTGTFVDSRFQINDIAQGDIPVPATLGLLGVGLVGLGAMARRRRTTV